MGVTTEARLAACEARAEAQFSLLMALYKLALFKGLTHAEELACLFNTMTTGLRTRLVQTINLPDVTRGIDAHLAEISKLRRDLEV